VRIKRDEFFSCSEARIILGNFSEAGDFSLVTFFSSLKRK